jgi:hypothetical protein
MFVGIGVRVLSGDDRLEEVIMLFVFELVGII